jgi:phage terminase large subunit
MIAHQYFTDDRWNKSDYIYTFETGSKIEFFSADQPDKVRGPRRDRLFINECNNIPYAVFDQLEVRTNDVVFLDWNPTNEFWFYDKVKNRNDCESIILTYKDNQALPESIKEAIEQRKLNRAWWRVYGEGQLGEIEARIYKNWQIIDEVPPEARLERYGVDYGYSNAPTAMLAVYYYNGAYVLDEIDYQKELSNKQIADTLKLQKSALVIADSAEPKSIDEIKLYGVSIFPSQKGPGSVLRGIQAVQAQKIFITKRSVNTIKEYRNYMWLTDKDGRVVNEEDPRCENHAMSAIRYAIGSLYLYPEELPILETTKKRSSEFAPRGEFNQLEPYQKSRFHYD